MKTKLTTILQILDNASKIFHKNHGRMRAFQALLSFRNVKSGFAFPSYKAIAKRAHCSETTVSKMVKDAEETGLIKVKRGYRRCWIRGIYRKIRKVNRYFIHSSLHPLKTLINQATRYVSGRVCPLAVKNSNSVPQRSVELDRDIEVTKPSRSQRQESDNRSYLLNTL